MGACRPVAACAIVASPSRPSALPGGFGYRAESVAALPDWFVAPFASSPVGFVAHFAPQRSSLGALGGRITATPFASPRFSRSGLAPPPRPPVAVRALATPVGSVSPRCRRPWWLQAVIPKFPGIQFWRLDKKGQKTNFFFGLILIKIIIWVFGLILILRKIRLRKGFEPKKTIHKQGTPPSLFLFFNNLPSFSLPLPLPL